MKEDNIDYFGNTYGIGQKVELEGNAVLMIAKFLTEVVQKETNYFAGFTYAEKTHEVKDEDGEIIKVETEWKQHNKNSFLLSSATENGGQLGLTSTGVKASQILSAILSIHKKNIEAGLTKTTEEQDAERVFTA